jgi:hypothetical protein
LGDCDCHGACRKGCHLFRFTAAQLIAQRSVNSRRSQGTSPRTIESCRDEAVTSWQ